ncbi:acyltransferase family protein [Larkinella soli]|uniref:acyltransferase family protein n=1 Tax=Larkinella soli TaxID=1770527 RepID=UPI000FFB714B|nr:acyltransferase [Larkinella soli]
MSSKTLNPEVLNPKGHFVILDGLRGVAALAIVVFHFMEWVFPDPKHNFIGHGFLAVDFFFCLSGFVIGYAYDDRIRQMGAGAFFVSRLIRLHPLVILGSVLGLLGFLFDPIMNQAGAYSPRNLLPIFLCSLFLIPFPVMKERAFNLFGFNAPAWSLFWEYVANVVYALVLCRIGLRTLLVLTVMAAAGIVWVSYRAGNLLGGWNGENFWDGGVRVSYSFLMGLLIFRSNGIIKNRLGFIGLSVLLSLAFFMPHFRWNWLAEAGVVLLFFPLVVSLGTGSSLSPGLKKVCELSGNLSYPLYMTHYAFIWIFGNYLTTYKPGLRELALVIIAGTLFLIGFAYVAMRVYDTPVRNYLTTKRKRRLRL